MAPEHKFATSARLCQEVLGAAADGALPLSECSEVIGDALRVLSCKGIKVAATRVTKDNDFDSTDPQADAQAIAGAAKGRLVSQMMKKHLVEAVIPVIIELKRMMEASRHPLLAELMAAAAALLKDHKTEIEDILAADRQLAKEILYDIKQAEAAEAARAAEQKEIAAAAGDGGAGGASKPAVAAPAKTPGTGGAAAALTHQAAKNTPADVKITSTSRPAAAAAAHKTPRSARPPGTSGHTPIAAQVLRQTASAEPKTGSHHHVNTPGSNLRPATGGSPTPGSGVATGATAATAKSTGRRPLSRLARMSSGLPGTAPRTGTMSLTSPALTTGEMGNGGMSSSPAQPRLRPGHEKIEANLLSGQKKEGSLIDDDEEEDHVELQFVVPGVNGAAAEEEAVSPKMWNVSPAVLPETSKGPTSGGSGVDGAAAVDEEMKTKEETDIVKTRTVELKADEKAKQEETTARATTRGRSRRITATPASEPEMAIEPMTRRKRKA